MANIFHISSRLIRSHVHVLDSQINPRSTATIIKTNREKKHILKQLNWHFVFPILIVIVTPLVGIVWLHYEATGRLSTNLVAEYRQSPYIFTHQMSSPSFYSPLDTAFSLDVVTSLCIFLVLLFTPPDSDARSKISRPKENKIKPAPKDSRNQNRNTSDYRGGRKSDDLVSSIEQMWQFFYTQRQIKLAVFRIFALTFVVCIAYFLINVWLNAVYTARLITFLFWLLLFPLFFWYLMYGKSYLERNFFEFFNSENCQPFLFLSGVWRNYCGNLSE